MKIFNFILDSARNVKNIVCFVYDKTCKYIKKKAIEERRMKDKYEEYF